MSIFKINAYILNLLSKLSLAIQTSDLTQVNRNELVVKDLINLYGVISSKILPFY